METCVSGPGVGCGGNSPGYSGFVLGMAILLVWPWDIMVISISPAQLSA